LGWYWQTSNSVRSCIKIIIVEGNVAKVVTSLTQLR
jgi:hypothetical protein